MEEYLRPIIHYSLHLLFPGFVAWFFYREQWKKVWLIFLTTMLIDLDHLLSSPVFDPNRCSINFHMVHTYYAAGFYCLMLFFNKTRIAAIGLIMHFLADLEDCLWI